MALSIISKINLDMKAPNAEIAYGNQYDSAGYINAQLLNDGEKWAVPSGAVAIVSYYKSDRIGGYYDTTSKNETAVSILSNDRSVVTIALDQQTMTTVGNVSMQINFYQNNQRLSTFAFILNVKPSPITSSNIDSKWFGNLLILSGVVVDDTLLISGAAADAATTGSRLGELSEDITSVENLITSVGNLKVNKPVSSPNGTNGQLLRTLGDGRTEWVTQGAPTDAQVGVAVEAWLDAHPEATTTVEDGSIGAKKLTEELQVGIFSKAFYDVTDYGIEPDSENDIYEDLFDLLHDIVHPNGGGVVFFPAGRYILSDSIIIPENTTFMGVGKETEIYFTGQYGWWGTGLGNGGSNVTIRDMKIDHLASPNIKTERNQSNLGGIGFSTVDFECQTTYHQTISPSSSIPRREMHGLKAINIWSDSTYILQVEPDSQYGVYDVLYENIYAPYSMVSIHPHEDNGFVHDVVVENVTCGLFRCGVGYGNAKNITVRNMHCSEIWAPDGNCIFEHVRIGPDVDPEWSWAYYTIGIGRHATFKDVTIEHGEQFNRAIGNGAEDYLILENVRISGFDNVWVNNTSTPGPVSFINCDFGNSVAFIPNGYAIGCIANFSNNANFKQFDSISFRNASGDISTSPNDRWSTTQFPTGYVVKGNTVRIQGALVLNNTDILFSINSNYARENIYAVVTVMKYESSTITKTAQILAKCDANGVFHMLNMTQDLSEYNRALFDITYLID